MQTGWPAFPRDLSDREDADNNILFETWTSNVAKFNMDEDSCDALRADIKNIKLARPELYNRTTAELIRRLTATAFEDLTDGDLSEESMYLSVEVMDDAGEDEDAAEG
jgi:hypothetical protein